MALESFLKWLNCSFIGISAFKCHFMWRVDLLTGGSSFLYHSMCVITTQAHTGKLCATEAPAFSFLFSCSLVWQGLNVDFCRTIPPLCLAKSEFTVAQSFAPEGEFEVIPRRRLESIPARAYSSVFGKSLSLSCSPLRIITPWMQMEIDDGIPTPSI